jgi:hypothetical protein
MYSLFGASLQYFSTRVLYLALLYPSIQQSHTYSRPNWKAFLPLLKFGMANTDLYLLGRYSLQTRCSGHIPAILSMWGLLSLSSDWRAVLISDTEDSLSLARRLCHAGKSFGHSSQGSACTPEIRPLAA